MTDINLITYEVLREMIVDHNRFMNDPDYRFAMIEEANRRILARLFITDEMIEQVNRWVH